ncbi:MAG: hypothetical protein ACFFDF_04005 [Candidatus Odinarchaeota archaeon]
MKNKRHKNEQETWDIINELKRCLTIYSILYQILEKEECVASEIINDTDICKATVYKYLNKAATIGLISKKNNTNSHKNGAHFTFVSELKLTEFLEEFAMTIGEFLIKLKKHPKFFDKKR